MKKYRFGVIGFAHLHVLELIRSFLAMPGQFEFIGAADTPPMIDSNYNGPAGRRSNLARFVEMMGEGCLCTSVDALLDRKPDLVLVTTEHAVHGTVLPQILRRGVHAVVDKPLAVCERDALAIDEAARSGQALCITNWFSYWKPGIRLAKKLIDGGIIGQVYKFQYRNPDSLGVFPNRDSIDVETLKKEWWYHLNCGGGSMIDYCSYGIVLADWFLGRQPESVFGFKANFHQKFSDAEDYASMILTYPEAVAVLEGTWTTVSSGLPTGPILWGDRGSLVVENYDHSNNTRICLYQHPYASEPDRVYHSEDYALEEGHRTLAQDVYYYLLTGEPLPYLLSLECNIKAARVLDAGKKSAETRRVQTLQSAAS